MMNVVIILENDPISESKESMMQKFFWMKTVILSTALLLSACGAGGPSTELNVAMTDFQFTPNTLSVPAGQEITVNASNNGAVVHDIVIMNYGTTVGNKYDEEDTPNIYWKIELQPGERMTATFTAPSQTGEYQIVCGTKGHFEAGMIGKLIVVAP
jgi:plastocyanin